MLIKLQEKLEVLDKIARLIRENPAVSVKELARRMGFAQERSIYYWLQKGRYDSIKQFKNDVLRSRPADRLSEDTGASGRDLEPAFVEEAEPSYSYRMPVVPVRQGGQHRPPPGRERLVVTALQLSRDAFAVNIETTEYTPWFLKGDLLLVEPSAEVRGGDPVLAWIPPKGTTVRYACGDNPLLLVHPADTRVCDRVSPTQGQARVMGKIVELIRRFQPAEP